VDHERGSLTRLAVTYYVAIVVLDDSINHGQAKPRPFPISLVGIERLKNMLPLLLHPYLGRCR